MSTISKLKLIPIYLVEILRRHAAEGEIVDQNGETYLSWKQIQTFLEHDYHMSVDQRALKRNLEDLTIVTQENREFQYEVICLSQERKYGDKTQVMHVGWRIEIESGFETTEIRTLIDTALASSMIPPKQIDQLIKKLSVLSPEEIAIPKVEFEGFIPTVNNQFFLNIELLNEAIREHKWVSFTMGVFWKDKKLHDSRPNQKPYRTTAIPLQLLVSKGNFYILVRYPDKDTDYKYRVDRILDVEILDEDAPTDPADDVNIVKYRSQHSYMMSGKVMDVVLRIDKYGLHTLFDQFGSNVHIIKEHEETFDVSFSSALYSVLFWAMQYYRSVEVISPQELRDELERAGKTLAEMYEGDPGKLALAKRQ